MHADQLARAVADNDVLGPDANVSRVDLPGDPDRQGIAGVKRSVIEGDALIAGGLVVGLRCNAIERHAAKPISRQPDLRVVELSMGGDSELRGEDDAAA